MPGIFAPAFIYSLIHVRIPYANGNSGFNRHTYILCSNQITPYKSDFRALPYVSINHKPKKEPESTYHAHHIPNLFVIPHMECFLISEKCLKNEIREIYDTHLQLIPFLIRRLGCDRSHEAHAGATCRSTPSPSRFLGKVKRSTSSWRQRALEAQRPDGNVDP